jgi:hypothetical protein
VPIQGVRERFALLLLHWRRIEVAKLPSCQSSAISANERVEYEYADGLLARATCTSSNGAVGVTLLGNPPPRGHFNGSRRPH